ncbi:MAG: hypothetical protein GY754_32525 [bacterium]|nr:hypothetical protein [bacterium]
MTAKNNNKKDIDRNVELVGGLVKKYRVTMPIPGEDQNDALSSKKKVYKRILITLGLYSLFAGIGIYIYFFIKKTGFNLFLAKIAASFLLVLLIMMGAYFFIDKFGVEKEMVLESRIEEQVNKPFFRKPDLKEVLVKSEAVKKIETVAGVDKKEAVAIDCRIGIKSFLGNTAGRKLRESAAQMISVELSRLKGHGYSKVLASFSNQKTEYVLTGTIEKLGDTFLLFVKIIEHDTSSIVFAAKEKIYSSGGLEDACKKIARRIAVNIPDSVKTDK